MFQPIEIETQYEQKGGAERSLLGFTHAVLLGTICRLAIRPISPVIDASKTGSAVGC